MERASRIASTRSNAKSDRASNHASNRSSDHDSNHRSNNDRIYVDEGNEDDECCDDNDSYHDHNYGDVPQVEATLIIPG
ncbi:hypothetical protein IG631_22379 [Alternaria alternata]|nr:hypothetical protein IG631_22379 [Alternaria alternata]